MATKRKTITKKTRFEVFKRDGFKCVYCGACAPEAVLVVDHIDPVANGGANEIVNYATACQPCNAGKSDRKLDDNSVLQKQRRQIAELGERREQLEMMLEWRNGLKQEHDFSVEVVADAWRDVAPGWGLNDRGRKTAKLLIKKYGLSKVLDAIDVAADSYIKRGDSGNATEDSQALGWGKLAGILALQSMPADHKRLFYIQGILRNRLNYVAPDAVTQMKDVLECVTVAEIEAKAKVARNWTEFSNWLYGQAL